MPPDGGFVAPGVGFAVVRFDSDVVHDSTTDPTSATNPANYELIHVGTGRELNISLIIYDPATRTSQLSFEPLPSDTYQLTVLIRCSAFPGSSSASP
jgi:hypothetical protein